MAAHDPDWSEKYRGYRNRYVNEEEKQRNKARFKGATASALTIFSGVYP
jgi:hypothetical protein